jgi:hypothetical protein
MEFSNWLMMEEIFPNKTATIFHRAGINATSKTVTNILNSDFKAGAGSGCMHGCGLYGTFSLESQFDSGMSSYGSFLIKFKITDLDKYIIIPPSVAKYIKGERWKLSDQLLDSYPDLIKSPSDLEELDEMQESSWRKGFVPSLIEEKVKGVLYHDFHGYTLVKYNPVNDGTITMIGYTVASALDTEKITELQNPSAWTTSTGTAKIRDIYKQAGKSGKVYPVRSDMLSSNDIMQMLRFDTDEAEKLDKSQFEKLGVRDLIALIIDDRRNKFIEILGPKVISSLKNMKVEEAYEVLMNLLVRGEGIIPLFKKLFGEEYLNKFNADYYKHLLFSVGSPVELEKRGKNLGGLISRIKPEDIEREIKTFKSYEDDPATKKWADKNVEIALNLIRTYYEDQNFVDEMFRKYGPSFGPAPKKVGDVPPVTGEKGKFPVFGESFRFKR